MEETALRRRIPNMRASPGKAFSLEDIVELVVGDEHAGSERATRKAVLDQCIQTLGQLREDMRAAANKGARLVEAIQFMEDIKGWDTGEAGVCTIREQALRGKPNFIGEFTGMPRSSRREYTRKQANFIPRYPR
ncbi:hypothetical protein AnigIFM63604_006879 [Aspergillus niger]|uniref:Uncharacterized protein n=1 Tax=Aspergillus niger TaxID=5061 RepID=A0A9W6A265_ASPNG|nr:hypothetical protein AnigIFM63604_006879 [Aspergillus niger]